MCIDSFNFACDRYEPDIDFHLIQYASMMASGADKGPCKPRGPGPLTVYGKIL
jgi:hypothetical protein